MERTKDGDRELWRRFLLANGWEVFTEDGRERWRHPGRYGRGSLAVEHAYRIEVADTLLCQDGDEFTVRDQDDTVFTPTKSGGIAVSLRFKRVVS